MPLSKLQSALRLWSRSLFHLFYPRCCVVCGDTLQEGEETLCLRCNMDAPRTNYHLQPGNPVERLFWGKVEVERASAYVFYRKGSRFGHLLHRLKYGGRSDVGVAMGRFMAGELQKSGFFAGVDVIVPVPLHRKKQRERGYNQSECLARGLSAVTGVPVDASAVERTRATETQTRKSAYERWMNVEGVFSLLHPERFAGKHVLLVDDVLTTGATVIACADAFAAVEGVRISVLALAVADA